MSPTDEHDDDLEPEVAEDAVVETEQYEEAEDEEVTSEADVTNRSERGQHDGARTKREEESEDEPSDSI